MTRHVTPRLEAILGRPEVVRSHLREFLPAMWDIACTGQSWAGPGRLGFGRRSGRECTSGRGCREVGESGERERGRGRQAGNQRLPGNAC